MEIHTDRREFLVLAAGGVLAFTRWSRSAVPLRIGVIGPPAHAADARLRDALDGLTLGMEEAVRTAGMFRREVEFVSATAQESGGGAIAASLLDRDCAALVTLLDGDAAREAARAAIARRRPCIQVLASPTHARAQPDGPGELFIMPPAPLRAEALLRELHSRAVMTTAGAATMLASSADAADLAIAVDRQVAQVTSTSPLLAALPRATVGTAPRGSATVVLAAGDPAQAGVALAALGGPAFTGLLIDLFGCTESLPPRELPARIARADLWAPTLVRFGAAQLNDRFRARFGSEAAMRGPAWSGWFAAKAIVETALRARVAADAGLTDALLRARFDGHKGTPLSFSPEGHLLQPLHVVGLADQDAP